MVNKTKQIMLRVTAQEKATIAAAANNKSLPMSAYIRMVALDTIREVKESKQ